MTLTQMILTSIFIPAEVLWLILACKVFEIRRDLRLIAGAQATMAMLQLGFTIFITLEKLAK